MPDLMLRYDGLSPAERGRGLNFTQAALERGRRHRQGSAMLAAPNHDRSLTAAPVAQKQAAAAPPVEGPTPPPIPSREAPVGSREWAACLLSEFPRDEALSYYERQLSYDQAYAEHKAARRRVGLAAHIRFAGEPERSYLLPPAEPEKPNRERKGLAARYRFRSGTPAPDRLAPEIQEPSPPLTGVATESRSEQQPRGLASKLNMPGDRSGAPSATPGGGLASRYTFPG